MTTSAASRHSAINPWTWQDPLGFAQAVAVEAPQRLLICSGQTAVDENGEVRFPGDMAAQLDAALDNLESLLKAAGFGLADVLRLNLYVTDIAAYFQAQGAFLDRFARRGIPVAATLVGVTALALPGLVVEVEATAAA